MEAILEIKGQRVAIALSEGEFEQISKAINKDTRPVMERIKSFDDVLADQGITASDFIKRIEYDTEDEAAYKRMKLIALAINEGELDAGQTWWEPLFNRDSGSGFSDANADFWCTHTNTGARLSFKSRELAVYAGQTFADIYKPFMLILNKK
jgi:hypothetical protein